MEINNKIEPRVMRGEAQIYWGVLLHYSTTRLVLHFARSGS